MLDDSLVIYLQPNVDVNAPDFSSLTPLHMAVQLRLQGCTSLLMAAGADPDVEIIEKVRQCSQLHVDSWLIWFWITTIIIRENVFCSDVLIMKWDNLIEVKDITFQIRKQCFNWILFFGLSLFVPMKMFWTCNKSAILQVADSGDESSSDYDVSEEEGMSKKEKQRQKEMEKDTLTVVVDDDDKTIKLSTDTVVLTAWTMAEGDEVVSIGMW